MNRQELISQIRKKKSFLCVGLDTDLLKVPRQFYAEDDPVFAFNRAVIDATAELAVAYKINTAFYESQGLKGWTSLAKTLSYIPHDCFTIADAKRGDIGNTAEHYAKTFFQTYPFDSVTVAPYMGRDSVEPFVQQDGKWAILLALTSNPGSSDFQLQESGGMKVYERVLQTAMTWGSEENLMFVVGATQKKLLAHVRSLSPNHFFLIPGVGAQGGDVRTVAEAAMNTDVGILVNVSRSIIFAGAEVDFEKRVRAAALEFQRQMAAFL